MASSPITLDSLNYTELASDLGTEGAVLASLEFLNKRIDQVSSLHS